MRIGFTEILLIVVLVILLFGSKKIPELMKNLAGGFRVFKQELKNKDTTEKNAVAKKPATKKPVKK